MQPEPGRSIIRTTWGDSTRSVSGLPRDYLDENLRGGAWEADFKTLPGGAENQPGLRLTGHNQRPLWVRAGKSWKKGWTGPARHAPLSEF